MPSGPRPIRDTRAIRDRPAPELATLKRDHRTHVYLADPGPDPVLGSDGPGTPPNPATASLVVKRYLTAPWRQALNWALRRHPVQREARAIRRLAHAGFPVVPCLGLGIEPRPLGGVAWLVTPYVGPTLTAAVAAPGSCAVSSHGYSIDHAAGAAPTPIDPIAACQAAVDLARRLAHAGWLHRDFKAGNLLIADPEPDPNPDPRHNSPDSDPARRLRMIDTGDARRISPRRRADAFMRMATLLLKTLRDASAPSPCLEAVRRGIARASE